MSVQLTADQELELASLAENEQKTMDELAQEAVARLLASRAEHRAAIKRSRESIAAGRVIEHEEVFSRLKQRFGW
jgi:predicted transcriptional regulator